MAGLAILVLSVAVAGCGEGSHVRTTVHAASLEDPPAAVKRPPPRPRIVPPKPPPPSPALNALTAALQHNLQLAGPQSGAVVFDLSQKTELFARGGGVKRPPASVEKVYTSIVALQELGPDARFQTTVLGTGHLGPGGIWHGSLYLRGGGDPTFGDGTFNRVWELGYGPTAGQLAQQLKNHGIRQVTGLVFGDGSLFDARPGGPATGYAADVPDFGGQLGGLTYDHGSTSGKLSPAEFAARQFTATLRSEGVQANAARFARITPPGAHQLASVNSPSLTVLLRLMDVPSDDLFAEMLTEQLGSRFGAAGTISDGAQVIHRQIVAEYDLHPRIVDGSGLSRGDHSSPLEVVDLLRDVWRTPVGDVLWNSLPVVGVSGTVQTIATGTPAQGHCVAKTGTLDYVTNLAGYCHSRGGHMLAFALFVDGPSNYRALVLIGRMVAAVAKY